MGPATPVTWYLHHGNVPSPKQAEKPKVRIGGPSAKRQPAPAGTDYGVRATKLASSLQEADWESAESQAPPRTGSLHSMVIPETPIEREILSQVSLLNVLRRAAEKLEYVCHYGKLPDEQERDWKGWLIWKRQFPPATATGKAKEISSVVLLPAELYQWMQRAQYVEDTISQLTKRLNNTSGTSPETAGTVNDISTVSAVTALTDQMSQLSRTSLEPRQAAFDDRALLYLQQMLMEKGVTLAPSRQALNQQLIHPEMTRGAAGFLVRLYRLRKAVQKAKRSKQLSDHDAVILQANILLDEYLTNEGDTDVSRKQMLVQHVLGGHLGGLYSDKQCLVLHVEASSTRQVETWGCCCPDVVLTGAQVQVSLLLDMTRHTESVGSKVSGMFFLNGKAERISVAEEFYESFAILADRTLWDTARNENDPIDQDDELADTVKPKKKRVITKKTSQEGGAGQHEKVPTAGPQPRKNSAHVPMSISEIKRNSTHSVVSMGSVSGAPKGKAPRLQAGSSKPLRRVSGGDGPSKIRRPSNESNRSSGDTAPSFYDMQDSPKAQDKDPLESTTSHSMMTSQIIPEIEKLGQLGKEVADILRSPSRHRRKPVIIKDVDPSEVSSDSDPIKVKPRPPPMTLPLQNPPLVTTDQSVGESVMVFQPPGDKIPSHSVRASDWVTTSAQASSTRATKGSAYTTGSSLGSSPVRKTRTPPTSRLRRPSGEDTTRSQSAPVVRLPLSPDPPAFKSLTQQQEGGEKKKKKKATSKRDAV
jgi:hypothetical protein